MTAALAIRTPAPAGPLLKVVEARLPDAAGHYRVNASVKLPVVTARMPDAAELRLRMEVPHGLTIAAIVRLALPGATKQALARVHVWLVTRDGEALYTDWSARPKQCCTIVIRIEPGKEQLRSILSIVIGIGVAFIAPYLIAPLGLSQFGAQIATAALQIGLNLAGGLLVNAIFPAAKPEAAERTAYAVTGWRNELRRDGPIPRLHGALRVSPIYAVPPILEVVGDDLHVRAVFNWGLGPLALSDFRQKDTPIGEFEGIVMEHRYGYSGDAPLTLVNSTFIAEQTAVALERPRPRDDKGEIKDGDAKASPITRRCAKDATGFRLILQATRGLIEIDDKGRKKSRSVDIAIRRRAWGATDWTLHENLKLSAKKEKGFYRQYDGVFPERGDWEIQLEMLSPESKDTGKVQDIQWFMMYSARPEYPISYTKPLALSAVLAKASNGVQGTLDAFNGFARSIARDFVPAGDAGGAWIEQATDWPPALALKAIQGNANPYPAPDGRIDWPAFERWQRFCQPRGLKYDRMHDFKDDFRAAIRSIGAAGRAVVYDNGVHWTVMIDQPRPAPVALLNARNCVEITGRVDYLKLPDAFRTSFRDRTSDYAVKDMVVPFPDFAGTPNIVETIDRPWITDPRQLYYDIRRYQLELLKRHVTWTATQRRSVRLASFGDMLVASRDFFAPGLHSARVTLVRGKLVELDQAFNFEPGQSYWIRFMRHSAGDAMPASILRPIKVRAGSRTSFRLDGPGAAPRADDIVHIVPETAGGMELILVRREAGKAKTSILTLKPAAPEIDAELDATAYPGWTGRSGTIVGGVGIVPDAPIVTAVLSGLAETGADNGLIVRLQPAPGGATVGRFEVRHRVPGAGVWLGPVSAAAAAGAVDLTGIYAPGALLEFQPRALNTAGAPGAWGPTVAVTMSGANAGMVPAPIGFQVTPASRNLGTGSVVVFNLFWTLPVYDAPLYPEVQWVDAGAGWAAPRTIMLGADATSHELVGGTLGDAYDWRLSFVDLRDGERGPWAVKLGVTATLPAIVGAHAGRPLASRTGRLLGTRHG